MINRDSGGMERRILILKKTFKGYKGAALYAKQLMQELGAQTVMRNKGGNWEVLVEGPKPSEVEAVLQSFRSLTEKELTEKWKERDTLEEWVVDVLHQALQEKIKLSDASSVILAVCPSCGQVAGNCTCGRNWW
jgi:hypothetical protein